jgi:hypothetical protein
VRKRVSASVSRNLQRVIILQRFLRGVSAGGTTAVPPVGARAHARRYVGASAGISTLQIPASVSGRRPAQLVFLRWQARICLNPIRSSGGPPDLGRRDGGAMGPFRRRRRTDEESHGRFRWPAASNKGLGLTATHSNSDRRELDLVLTRDILPRIFRRLI